MTERDERAKATIVYLKHDFTPASREDAELIRVCFDDGRVLHGVPLKEASAK